MLVDGFKFIDGSTSVNFVLPVMSKLDRLAMTSLDMGEIVYQYDGDATAESGLYLWSTTAGWERFGSGTLDISKILVPMYTGLLYSTLALYISTICKPPKFLYEQVLKNAFENHLQAVFSEHVKLSLILFLTFSMVLPNTELFISLKKSFSNLAWSNFDIDFLSPYFHRANIEGIEIAPTAIWDNAPYISGKKVNQYSKNLSNLGFKVSAIQSLFFEVFKLIYQVYTLSD
jgi:hypothetical protein